VEGQFSLFDFDDDGPPAQWHSETSVEAAELIEPNAATLRGHVLAFLRARGEHGAIDEEVQEGLDMNPSTQRPRRIELYNAGLVKDSDRTRLTRRCRKSVVWTAVKL